MSRDRVLALLGQMNEDASTYDANQGLGGLGWWPAEGTDPQVILNAIECTETKFKYGGRNGAPKVEVPAAGITFHYQLIEDPDSPSGTPRSFKGRQFVIPAVPMSSLPEMQGGHGKQQTRVRIEKERLMGHLTTLLGSQPPQWQAGLQSVFQKLDAAAQRGAAVTVKLRLGYQDKTDKNGKPTGTRVPDSEYIQELIAG